MGEVGFEPSNALSCSWVNGSSLGGARSSRGLDIDIVADNRGLLVLHCRNSEMDLTLLSTFDEEGGGGASEYYIELN